MKVIPPYSRSGKEQELTAVLRIMASEESDSLEGDVLMAAARRIEELEEGMRVFIEEFDLADDASEDHRLLYTAVNSLATVIKPLDRFG